MAKPNKKHPGLKDEEREAVTRRHVEALSAAWKEAHEARTAEVEAGLLKDRAEAGTDETLLLHLAAHDAALCEKLGQAEQQLGDRLLAMVDNAGVALALARALKQVAVSRDVTTRRLQGLLEAAGVLRGQRKLATIVPLRRVA